MEVWWLRRRAAWERVSRRDADQVVLSNYEGRLTVYPEVHAPEATGPEPRPCPCLPAGGMMPAVAPVGGVRQ